MGRPNKKDAAQKKETTQPAKEEQGDLSWIRIYLLITPNSLSKNLINVLTKI
jgi:hypothetical protein